MKIIITYGEGELPRANKIVRLIRTVFPVSHPDIETWNEKFTVITHEKRSTK